MSRLDGKSRTCDAGGADEQGVNKSTGRLFSLRPESNRSRLVEFLTAGLLPLTFLYALSVSATTLRVTDLERKMGKRESRFSPLSRNYAGRNCERGSCPDRARLNRSESSPRRLEISIIQRAAGPFDSFQPRVPAMRGSLRGFSRNAHVVFTAVQHPRRSFFPSQVLRNHRRHLRARRFPRAEKCPSATIFF